MDKKIIKLINAIELDKDDLNHSDQAKVFEILEEKGYSDLASKISEMELTEFQIFMNENVR